jgi:hypothetical protein
MTETIVILMSTNGIGWNKPNHDSNHGGDSIYVLK